MKNKALSVLQRLRLFEYEKEQMKLQHKQMEEVAQSQRCEEARSQMDNNYRTATQTTSVFEISRMDAHFREAVNNYEKNNGLLRVIQADRQRQIEQTFKAKRKLEMIESVLHHRHIQDLNEKDLAERREIDDLTQSQYVRRQEEIHEAV
jgi:hypothetical protein